MILHYLVMLQLLETIMVIVRILCVTSLLGHVTMISIVTIMLILRIICATSLLCRVRMFRNHHVNREDVLYYSLFSIVTMIKNHHVNSEDIV